MKERVYFVTTVVVIRNDRDADENLRRLQIDFDRKVGELSESGDIVDYRVRAKALEISGL